MAGAVGEKHKTLIEDIADSTCITGSDVQYIFRKMASQSEKQELI